MSYDLHLTTDAPPEAVQAWFHQRGYALGEEQVSWEVAGVAFTFDIRRVDGGTKVQFELHFARPHTFGLAAEPEVTAFVEAFSPAIHDPQIDGMGAGPYSPEGFLRGWNAGNAFGVRVLLQHDMLDQIWWQPRARNEAHWRWNRARDAYGVALGSIEQLVCFCPSVLHALVDGELTTAVAWSPDVGAAVPLDVDWVICRQPDGALGWRRLEELADLFDAAEVRGPQTTVRIRGRDEAVGMRHALFPAPLSDAVKAALDQGGAAPGEVVRVAMDRILDEELRGGPPKP